MPPADRAVPSDRSDTGADFPPKGTNETTPVTDAAPGDVVRELDDEMAEQRRIDTADLTPEAKAAARDEARSRLDDELETERPAGPNPA